jgi:hypothetical protein
METKKIPSGDELYAPQQVEAQQSVSLEMNFDAFYEFSIDESGVHLIIYDDVTPDVLNYFNVDAESYENYLNNDNVNNIVIIGYSL